MMAEEGRKNDVRLFSQMCIAVIGRDPFRFGEVRVPFPRIPGALWFNINTRSPEPYASFLRPPLNGPQVVPATATDLAYMQVPLAPGDISDTPDRYIVTAEQGVDGVQFIHVPPDVREGNARLVQQFRLV
jgi:hypothetical protein